MFSVDEPTAEAIRNAYNDGGELAGVAELRRYFPLIATIQTSERSSGR